MKRTSAVLKSVELHEKTPFCAAHPDEAGRRNAIRMDDTESITLGPAQGLHPRLHANPGTMMHAKKKTH